MEYKKIKVEKHARFIVVGDPNVSSNILFALHGYGQSLERFANKFTLLEKHNTAVVIPEGLHRFYTKGFSGEVGASWMTKEDRETDIEDYIAYLNQLAEQFQIDKKNVHVLGFSQGAATACRWVANGSINVQSLILWAGLVPPDIDPNDQLKNLRATNLFLAWSETDQFRNEEMWDEQYALLRKYDLTFSTFQYEGGHKIPHETLEEFWIDEILK